jgi:para-nitrobenzyl esterase
MAWFDVQSASMQFERFPSAGRSAWRLSGGCLGILVVVVCCLAGCGRRDPGLRPEPNPGTLRQLEQGELIGSIAENGAHVWRGIPFAKPPVGADRWRAPQPQEPWEGIHQALDSGPPCVQANGFLGSDPNAAELAEGEAAGNEDCLRLNVFAPAFAAREVPSAEKALPVMVWIHGGGNTVGSAAIYDGSVLAQQQRVIVVTTNYRLGMLGWFSHAALGGEGVKADDASGNYGSLDLIRSLEWVRDNITAFGGDPRRVTIFGESAGGRNVMSLLASPPAKGLFHRAISQSGSTSTSSVESARNLHDDPEQPGHEFSSGEVLLSLLQADGRAADRDQALLLVAEMSPDAVAEFLRGNSPSELLDAYATDGMGGMYRMPQVIRDGHVFPKAQLLERFRRRGAYNAVPVIVGSNRDESKLFLMGASDAVARFVGIPLWFKDERNYDVMAQYQSLAWKAGGVDEPAAALRGSQGPTVYAYRFDWDEEPTVLWIDFSSLLGAAHGLEIPFVFGTLTLMGAEPVIFDDDRMPAARTLSNRMMSYWAEFAYSGDPGRGRGGDLLPWHAWEPSSAAAPRFMIFDTEIDGGLRMSSDSVTLESVVERAQVDPLFKDQRERCEFYYDLAVGSERFGEAEYSAVPCGEYPLADFPWDD